MNRRIYSRLEMGHRALEFSRAHPVDSSGYATALKQLEEQLARSDQLAQEQARGTAEVRAAPSWPRSSISPESRSGAWPSGPPPAPWSMRHGSRKRCW